MTRLRRILIAHPARQHSHQLASALEEAGVLTSYLTFLPTERIAERWLPGLRWAVRRVGSLAPPIGIADHRIRHWSLPWLVKRSFDAVTSNSASYASTLAAFTFFDLWAASWIDRLKPDAVIGYETASVATFQAAGRVGALRILDAASFASPTQDRLVDSEAARSQTTLGRWTRRRKAIEVSLADFLLTCSDIAAASYRDAGFSSDRIIVNSPGCDVAKFSAHPRTASGAIKFCFVGHASDTKGFRLLTKAFARTRVASAESELHVFGDMHAARQFGIADGENGVRLRGKLSHEHLSAALAAMDVIVLPSQLDSFGLSIAEALAAGVFALVSENVGAKQLIVDDRIGAVVPIADEDELTRRMIDCAEGVDRLRDAAGARRTIAASADWSAYRRRATEMLGQIDRRADAPLAIGASLGGAVA